MSDCGEFMEYTTLKELYLGSVGRFADYPCSSMYGGECLTYGQFSERVDKVAALLRRGGLVRGDKVALLSNNMPNWAVCYFATVCSGMVIVPLLSDFSPVELEKLIRHCGAKALFVSDKLFSKISKNTVAELDLVIRTMNLGIISHRSLKKEASQLKQALSNSNSESDLISSREEEEVHSIAAAYTPTPEDLAAIIYTSGTTSAPKGVMLTHGNLASQILMDFELFPVYHDDIFLSILPLSHTYECSLGMLLPFSRGAHVVYLDKLPTASTLMPAMKVVRPTIMLSVPLIIEKIYKNTVALRFRKNRLLLRIYSVNWLRKMIHRRIGHKLRKVFGGRLRFFGIGGAKLDADTESFLMEAHFPYAIGYGLTETAPLIAGAVPGKVRYRSTGPVLGGIQARLENIDKETGDGELVVLSPSTMLGYYDNPEATANVMTPDGWFRTKDVAHFDEEGNLYIIGRTDNLILGPEGENIYPEEIESVINSHFLVTDSLVKKEKGKLVAMVRFDNAEMERKYKDFREEMSTRIAEMKAELKNYVNSKVNRSSRISEVKEQQSDFEKTPTHKIRRFKYQSPDNEVCGENDAQRQTDASQQPLNGENG